MKMQKSLLKTMVLLASICAVPAVASAYELVTKTETITWNELQIDLKKTADNFIVMYDSSSSMDALYKKTGKKKVDLERAIFKVRSQLIPDSLKYNAGIYSFTPEAKTFPGDALKPYYEMQPYNYVEFQKAIDSLPIKASGPTLLQDGLRKLDGVLAKLTGHTVVYIATDCQYSEWEGMDKPIDIARGLARKYDVAFYVIDSSGKKDLTKKLREGVASISPRSRVITFDQFIENPLMLTGSLFIIDARLVKKSMDIEKVIGIKLTDALFAFDSAEINEKYAEPLKKLGAYLQKTPKAKLSLAAFTDNKGPSDYNLNLSRRRAESIVNYLEKNFKIASERMVANYYGEANPVASNDTAEGRAQNRRVEGFIFGLE